MFKSYNAVGRYYRETPIVDCVQVRTQCLQNNNNVILIIKKKYQTSLVFIFRYYIILIKTIV